MSVTGASPHPKPGSTTTRPPSLAEQLQSLTSGVSDLQTRLNLTDETVEPKTLKDDIEKITAMLNQGVPNFINHARRRYYQVAKRTKNASQMTSKMTSLLPKVESLVAELRNIHEQFIHVVNDLKTQEDLQPCVNALKEFVEGLSKTFHEKLSELGETYLKNNDIDGYRAVQPTLLRLILRNNDTSGLDDRMNLALKKLDELKKLKRDLERDVASLQLPKGLADKVKELIDVKIGQNLPEMACENRHGCRDFFIAGKYLYSWLMKEYLSAEQTSIFEFENERRYFGRLISQLPPGHVATMLSAFVAHLDNFAEVIAKQKGEATDLSTAQTWTELSLSFEIGAVRAALSRMGPVPGFEDAESHVLKVVKYFQRYQILGRVVTNVQRLGQVSMKIRLDSNYANLCV